MGTVIPRGEKLVAAIEKAKRWAADNGVPLTLERAAVFLESDREELLSVMKDTRFCKERPRDARLLRALYAFCNAEIADALVKSGRQTGVLLLAKTNYRYEEDDGGTVVPVFTGEDELT